MSYKHMFGCFRVRGCLVLINCVCFAAPAAYAAEVNDVIYVTATRKASAIKETSYTINILSTDELMKRQPRTLPEALAGLPGVMVQKTANGHGSPYIRGFTGNRTLAVIDGVRYNNATYRDGANEYFSHIDPLTIARIELLSGPASTLYGSEAVGGSLHLYTHDTEFQNFERGEPFIEGLQSLRASTSEHSLISRSVVNFGSGGHWGARIGISAKGFGNVRAADLGELPKTGYEELDFDIKLEAAITDEWTASFVHQSAYQDDVWRTHSTVFAKSFSGSEFGSDLRRSKDQHRQLNYVKLKGAPATGFFEQAELTISHQPRRDEETRIRNDGRRIEQSFDSVMWGVDVVFTSPVAIGTLTYGADYYDESIDSDRIETTGSVINIRIQGPVGDDARYRQLGAFFNADIPISSRLNLEVGGRLSHIDSYVGRLEDPDTGLATSFEGDWQDFSGSLRAFYQFGASSDNAIWAGISQSFRAPNVADVSRFGRSRSTEFEVAANLIGPESFLTYEAGARIRFGRVHLTTSYHYTDIKDYIETSPTGRIVDGLAEVRKQNTADGFIQGVEVSAGVDLGSGFILDGNITWTDGALSTPLILGQASTISVPISRLMPLTGNARLRWSGDDFYQSDIFSNLWAELDMSVAARADSLNTADLQDTQRIPPGGTPGYVLLNLRAGITINHDIDLNLGITNFRNSAYRVHGSGSNEPGRGVMIGAVWRL